MRICCDSCCEIISLWWLPCLLSWLRVCVSMWGSQRLCGQMKKASTLQLKCHFLNLAVMMKRVYNEGRTVLDCFLSFPISVCLAVRVIFVCASLSLSLKHPPWLILCIFATVKLICSPPAAGCQISKFSCSMENTNACNPYVFH